MRVCRATVSTLFRLVSKVLNLLGYFTETYNKTPTTKNNIRRNTLNFTTAEDEQKPFLRLPHTIVCVVQFSTSSVTWRLICTTSSVLIEAAPVTVVSISSQPAEINT